MEEQFVIGEWGTPVTIISLRDYFAGKAMQGLCVNVGRNEFALHEKEVMAKHCFEYAEAMLKEKARIEGDNNG